MEQIPTVDKDEETNATVGVHLQEASIAELHQKLDKILEKLERWESDKGLTGPSARLKTPRVSKLSWTNELESKLESKLSLLADPTSKSSKNSNEASLKEAGSIVADEDSQRSVKKKKKGNRHVAMPSVGLHTWATQLRTAVGTSTNLKVWDSCVPSLQQMDGAFVQAVAREKKPFFEEDLEQRDREMHRLGVESSDIGEESQSEASRSLQTVKGHATGEELGGAGLDNEIQQHRNLPGNVDCDGARQRMATTLSHLSQQSQVTILHSAEGPKPVRLWVIRQLMAAPAWFFLLGLVAVLQSIANSIFQEVGFERLSVSSRYGPTVAASVFGAAGATSVLLLRQSLQREELNLALDKLQVFLLDFRLQWNQVPGREYLRCVCHWLLMVSFFIISIVWQQTALHPDPDQSDPALISTIGNAHAAVAVVLFSLTSLLVVVVAYIQCHIMWGLDRSLDCWCCSIMDSDFCEGVESWNSMQALLKCLCREISGSFLALQIFGALGFIYVLTCGLALAVQRTVSAEDLVVEGCAAGALLTLFSLSVRVCAFGAALTEKCNSLPAFVNQIPTEEALDESRAYLVRFIKDSSTGFAVRNAKITWEMFLKQFVAVGGLFSGTVGVLLRLQN